MRILFEKVIVFKTFQNIMEEIKHVKSISQCYFSCLKVVLLCKIVYAVKQRQKCMGLNIALVLNGATSSSSMSFLDALNQYREVALSVTCQACNSSIHQGRREIK